MMKRNLLFLLTFIVSTMTVWAQGGVSTEYWTLTLDENWAGGQSTTIPNIPSGTEITLTSDLTPVRSDHTFTGWALGNNYAPIYSEGSKFFINADLTLYAIWDDTPIVYGLTYIFNENSKTAELTGYAGAKPTGAFKIPATVTVDNVEYSVTSIGIRAFDDCTGLTSVTIPNSVTSINGNAFYDCI